MKRAEQSKSHLFFFEALLALMLLGVVTTVLIRVFLTAYQISRNNEHRMRAIVLNSEAAERIKSQKPLTKKEGVWDYNQEGITLMEGEVPKYRMRMQVEEVRYESGLVQEVFLEVSMLRWYGETVVGELKLAKYYPDALGEE